MGITVQPKAVRIKVRNISANGMVFRPESYKIPPKGLARIYKALKEIREK